MAERGQFILFEGGEGSGKTGHSQAVAERLKAEGHDVLWTREPGGSNAVCAQIRETIMMEDVVPRAELLLFLANRAQHVEQVIKPALAEGKIVICDRFSPSTMAYQLSARRLDRPQFIRDMDDYARDGLWPDAVFYLHVPPEEGVKRRLALEGVEGEEVNRLDKEAIDFHERVHEQFERMAEEGDEWVSISTLGPREENTEKIYNAVKERLGL